MEEMDLEFLINFIISFNMSKFEVYAPTLPVTRLPLSSLKHTHIDGIHICSLLAFKS